MTFNTALTGLRASTSALDITGNNIANSSTAGFKQSRAEFSDVYASSVIGGGGNQIGNGVRVSDVAQQFSQGNISFTQNALDMAINGDGFFVLSAAGTQLFSRAGQFGVDDNGFLVSNDGARLQGFPANPSGVVSGVLDDLRLDSASIPPRQTTLVDINFNLDANEQVLATRGATTTSNGPAVGAVLIPAPANNGYTAGTINIDGTAEAIPSAAGLTAEQIAAELSAVSPGISANATTATTLDLTAGSFPVLAGELQINGQSVIGTDEAQLAASINALSNITATLAGTTINIVHDDGNDLRFDVGGAGAPFSVDVGGAGNTIAAGGNTTAIVGGEVNVTIDEGISFGGGTSNVFDGTEFLNNFTANGFDPTDQDTYNNATSVNIFDSLGSPHRMTMFFVKESSAVNPPNTWTMYVQIDGLDVGDPDPLAADPTAPTQLGFNLQFNTDGSLNQSNTDPLIITNWTPTDADGNPAMNALGPINGATLPIPEPPTSSNFEVDIFGSTQFAGSFSVNELNQSGFATGQLSGVDIDDSGVIFARYTNGEALTLGQVALADFANEQGLTPIGNTSWAQSFESGEPVIGAPQTASRGAITAGALEESNVELAEELVALIIAQRNFQANSRTIETANEITQTIINLR